MWVCQGPRKQKVEVLEAAEVTKAMNSINAMTEEAVPAPSVAPDDLPAPSADPVPSLGAGKVATAVAMKAVYQSRKATAMKETADKWMAKEKLEQRLFDAKMGRLTKKKNRRGARKPKASLGAKEAFRAYDAIWWLCMMRSSAVCACSCWQRKLRMMFRAAKSTRVSSRPNICYVVCEAYVSKSRV